MNVGLLFSPSLKIDEETLRSFFENPNLVYIAELGDHIFTDLTENLVKSLVIIGEVKEDLIYEIEQRTGINPIAVETIPEKWIKFSKKHLSALISAYIAKQSFADLAYYIQPIRASKLSRRNLIRFRLYEYLPYPVLADELRIEREINKCIESCPKKIIIKAPEGPQVSKPEECTYCGYCSGSSYLGYLELPTFSTMQFVSYVNTIVEKYGNAKLLFTPTKNVEISEGVFPVVIPIGGIHDSFLLSAYSAGLLPIIYASAVDEIGMKRLEEIPSHFPGTSFPILKVKNEEELEKAYKINFEIQISKIPDDVLLSRRRRRGLLIWAINEMSKKVKLNEEEEVDGIFSVEVNPEKCVLCGVCVRMCQMLVPEMRNNGDEIILGYNLSNCIGSQRCIKNCPENAITFKGKAKIKDILHGQVIANKVKLQRCRFCGKPIGSSKVKSRVDELLTSLGYSAQYTDVCNDCKQKILTKMWIERMMKNGSSRH